MFGKAKPPRKITDDAISKAPYTFLPLKNFPEHVLWMNEI